MPSKERNCRRGMDRANNESEKADIGLEPRLCVPSCKSVSSEEGPCIAAKTCFNFYLLTAKKVDRLHAIAVLECRAAATMLSTSSVLVTLAQG